MEDGQLLVHGRAVLPLLKPVQLPHFEIRSVPALDQRKEASARFPRHNAQFFAKKVACQGLFL